MKADITVPVSSCTVTLEISTKEAQMIKALVQNPNCKPEDESAEMRQLRQDLWNLAENILFKLKG